MKKKFKIILLIATILLFILFLFASCRKTNAYTDGAYYGDSFYITSTDTNNALLVSYIPEWESSARVIGYINTTGNYFYYYLDIDTSTNKCIFKFIDNENGLVFETNNYNPKYVISIDIIFAQNFRNQYPYFAINFRINYYKKINNNTAILNDFDDYVFDSYLYQPQTAQYLNDDYSSQSGLRIVPLATEAWAGNNFLGTFNIYEFDCQDYSTTLTEMRNDVYDDYILYDYNKIPYLYQEAYTTGYNAGFSAGYDDGYSAGETAGYTAGYNAGLSAGYDNGYRDGESAGYQDGYDAGLSAGYNNGYQDGYDDARDYWQPIYYQLGYEAGEVAGYNSGLQAGYNSGYNAGYEDGQAGRTAVSPVFNIISGVFDVVASVLGIYLFPGITIGTFILVPLFFSIIGLVIWVWKKG